MEQDKIISLFNFRDFYLNSILRVNDIRLVLLQASWVEIDALQN